MKKLLTVWAILALSLAACSAQAAVWGTEQPPEDGYAKTIEYKRAMSGTLPNSIETQSDLNYQTELVPENRSYMGLSIGQISSELHGVRNRSRGNRATAAVASLTSVAEDAKAKTLKWGHMYAHWNLEGELYFPGDLTYTASPVLESNGAFRYTAKITTYAAFMNAEYDFFEFYHVRPYLGAGLGLAMKVVNVTYSEGRTGARNVNYMGLPLQYYAGLKVQVTPQLGLNISWRAIELGPVDLPSADRHDATAGTRVALFSDKFTNEGIFVGLMYRFK